MNRRYPSIDLLRALAIILMVLVHFAENLSGAHSYYWLPSGFGAPIFSFLVGVSYRLWLNAQEARGKTDREISKRTIRRGLFLFGLGFAFNIFVWLPEDTFNWDVLTFIGTAFIALNLARKIPASISIVVCLVVFAFSPALRAVADYPAFWANGYFECDLTLSDVLLGFFCTGYFPLLPWIIFPLAGFVTGSLVFSESPQSTSPLKRLVLLGAALIATAVMLLLLRPHASVAMQKHLLQGWSMFPPSMAYVSGTLGFTLLAFAASRRWLDLNPRFSQDSRLASFATTFSRHSLSIYLLHHIVHLWPLWIYGAIKGPEPTYFWQNALPPTVSLLLALIFLVLCYYLFRWMDRTGKSGVESWMRWVCD